MLDWMQSGMEEAGMTEVLRRDDEGESRKRKGETRERKKMRMSVEVVRLEGANDRWSERTERGAERRKERLESGKAGKGTRLT